MTALKWDGVGERYYENGTKKGVLFVMNDDGTYGTGVAWNGLTGVDRSPDGGDATAIWADDIKYGSIRAAENEKGTINAFTYPEEFEECDGSRAIAAGVFIKQQPRKRFAFCYRTNIGNDVSDSVGYKIHIVYNASCSPSSKSYETINDSPDAATFSWDYEADPVSVADYQPSAAFEIDSRTVAEAKLTQLENQLYGTDGSGGTGGTDPTLPTPAQLVALFTAG